MIASRLIAALVVASLPIVGFAQEKGPSAEEVQALKKTFDEERAGAIEKKFPASALERADELAKQADEAVKAGKLAAAGQFLREARWLVPYVPTDLPPNVDRVLGIARMRHGDHVLGVVFSPNGKQLATASRDATVKIWDLGNGRELRTYRGSKDPVRAIAWSRDGKWVASTAGNEIHIWDPESGKLKTALKGHDKPASAIAFAPDGQTLASGSDDTSVRLWDLAKGTETANLNADFDKKQKNQVNAITFSPNGKLVAAVNGNGQLQIWNPGLEKAKRLVSGFDAHPPGPAYQVAFGKDTSIIYTSGTDSLAKQWVGLGPDGETIPGHGRPTKLEGHTQNVTALAVSQDGKFLATGSSDKTIRLWDMTGTSARLARVYQGHSEEVASLAFSPDGQTLASGSNDQSVRLWRVSLADEHQNFADHTAYVWTAAFSPDGKMFADAGVDKVVYLRDTAGKVLHKLEGHTGPVTAVAFSADSSKLASVGGDQVVRIWKTSDGKLIKELKGHTGPIMAVAFGGNDLLITGGIDKTARVWDVNQDQPKMTLPANKSMIGAVALRADGKQAMVGTADGMLRIYDLSEANPKETAAFTAHLAGVGDIVYGPDGTKIATCGGDGLVKYWNLSGAPVPPILAEFKGHNKPVSSVAFNSDGRFLVSGGGDNVVRVWDLATKTELRALRGHLDWISSVAFGTNGRTLLSASVDKTVKVWELSSGETAKPVGHSRRLNTIAVSADGRWVASGSEDRTIKIWDAAAGMEAFTLDAGAGGHDADVTSVAFDPTGKKLVSGGDDRKIVIWDLVARKPITTLAVDQRIPFLIWSSKGDKFVAWQSSKRGDAETNNFKSYDPTGKPLNSLDLKDRAVLCTTFTTDGEMAALGFADGSVQLWNLKSNERVGGDWAAFMADLGDIGVTPDKKKVVAIDAKLTVKIYDVAKKEVVKTFEAHKSGLPGLMVGPDGSRFATYSDNGEVKLWETDTGKELRTWSLPTPVRNLAFSADGKKLITANGDTTMYVLNLP
ncbi:MAG TPA: WD40 repeat domain-containing protein [Gemmataceae bacterium]|jgi:WD40 repeat protein|nr:WD40 repeat domain-containing protein [Gemmataceae bacterium]